MSGGGAALACNTPALATSVEFVFFWLLAERRQGVHPTSPVRKRGDGRIVTDRKANGFQPIPLLGVVLIERRAATTVPNAFSLALFFSTSPLSDTQTHIGLIHLLSEGEAPRLFLCFCLCVSLLRTQAHTLGFLAYVSFISSIKRYGRMSLRRKHWLV